MSIPIRLTNEIATEDLGVACIYCGHVCRTGSAVLSFEEAARAGIELHIHWLCAETLTGKQIIGASVIRTVEQLKRGYYGPQFLEDAWNAQGRPQLLVRR